MRVLPLSKEIKSKAWPRLQDGLFVALTVVLWLAGCALAAAGAITAIFFCLSGARLHGFLLHLHNLTVRYVAAGPARQEAFADLISGCGVAVVVVICILRSQVLCQRLRGGLRRADRGQA